MLQDIHIQRALFLLLSLFWWPEPVCGDANQSQSRYDRIVIALQDGPPDWRAEFATLALAQLYEAYRMEAELTRDDAASETPKLQRWSRSVEGYARQLLPLLEDIDNDAPVELKRTAGSELMLTVAERSIILAHPRPSQQQVFEFELLQEFCTSIPCQNLLYDQLVESTPGFSTGGTEPDWQFTADSRACAFDGVRISFRVDSSVARLRRSCTAFFQELGNVLRAIQGQVDQSVRIEWNHLVLTRPSLGQQHLLQLNRAGDGVLVSAPMLYQRPELLQAVTPWLSAKLSASEARVELDSTQLP